MGITIPVRRELSDKHDKWSRISVLIENNEEKLKESNFCLKLPNETLKAYEMRQKVFSVGFVNPSIELITAPANTIFRNEIKEEISVKDTRLNLFQENVLRGRDNEVPLKQYMKESICTELRSNGTIFIIMDMPRIEVEQSEETQKEGRIWPYLNIIDNNSVLNYQYVNGELLWFAYQVEHQDPWLDPAEKQPTTELETRYWTRTQYVRIGKDGNPKEIIDHNLGFVPIIIQASFKPRPDSIIGESPFITTSRLLITANNHLNTINMELWKHSNALLLLHKASLIAENSSCDNEGNFSLKTIPDGSAFIWDGEQRPDYLIRDLAVIEPALQLYHLYMDAAIDNEKAASSVPKSGYSGEEAVKAGIALLIERDPIMANIVATALDMESIHNRILIMADKMINDGQKNAKIKVHYDKDYDLKSFKEDLENLKMIKNEIRVPSKTLMEEEYKKVVVNEVKDKKTQKKCFVEIEEADEGDMFMRDEQLEGMLNQNKFPPNKKEEIKK